MKLLMGKIHDVEEEVKKLIEENQQLKVRNEFLEKVTEAYDGFTSSITPVQVYRCKTRGNTTVKFLDGSSVTVHKMKGDKDCLETAIVYALFKKVYPKRLLTNLVETTKKVRKSRCKKG